MDKRIITPSTLVIRKSDVLESEVHGEIVALDVGQGQCFGFNSSASSIWRLLDKETSAHEICTALQSEFDIDSQQCQDDVLRVLNELRDKGLINISSD